MQEQKSAILFPLNIKILDHENEIFKPAMKDFMLADFCYVE
jgi:hypothetical protein